MAPEEILSSADSSRRGFLKKVLAGTTFAAPVIASFSMEGLSSENAWAAAASNQCFVANQTLSTCCGAALEITERILRFEISVMFNVVPLDTAARLVGAMGKVQAAMVEGIAKGKGECVNRPAQDQFRKAIKELDHFKRLVSQICGDSIEELTAFADETIHGIDELLNGNCTDAPC